MVTITYPKYKGYVFMTYKQMRGVQDLRAQIDTSYKFVEGHFSYSSGIDENKFVDRPNHLSGTTIISKDRTWPVPTSSGSPTACGTSSVARSI